MTFRSIKSVMPVALLLFAGASAELAMMGACGKPGADRNASRARGTTTDSSAGAIAPAAAMSDTLGKLASNHTGRIPVLEYHIIGRDKNSQYTRTVASFKADLEDVYKRGYRPITI